MLDRSSSLAFCFPLLIIFLANAMLCSGFGMDMQRHVCQEWRREDTSKAKTEQRRHPIIACTSKFWERGRECV